MLLIIPGEIPQPRKLDALHKIPESADQLDFAFDGKISLLAVQSSDLVNNRKTSLKYYWLAEQDIQKDFTVLTNLVIPMPEAWEFIDSQQTHPGNGLAPTSSWEQGQIIEDQITILPRATLNGPTLAFIEVSLKDGDRHLPVSFNDQIVNNAIAKQVILQPDEPLIPNQASLLEESVNFGGLFDLVGLSNEEMEGSLEVTLWWKAKDITDEDYTVFIHILNDQGELLAQSDRMPNQGLSPTHIWNSDDIVSDKHYISVEQGSGTLLLVGVYDPNTGIRLQASQGDKTLQDNVYKTETK